MGHLAAVCRDKNKLKKTENNESKRETKKACEGKHNFLSEDFKSLDSAFDSLFSITEEHDVLDERPFKIELNVDCAKINFEVDTGSPITAISEKFYYDSHLKSRPLRSTPRRFRDYEGTRIIPTGKLIVDVNFGEINFKLEIFVFTGRATPILGRGWMRKLKIPWWDYKPVMNLFEITEDESLELEDILDKHRVIFKTELGTYTTGRFKLKLKENASPVFHKPRPEPFALRDLIDRELDRLVAANVLTPVESSEWATPIVPVMKSNGQVRLCGDYKITLNPNLKIDRHPVPRISEMLPKLKGSCVFSKLDLAHAYQQVELDEESRALTTISTQKGLYEYTRLGYGTASAPGLFQREMEKLLADLEGLIQYFDDFVVFEKL